MKGALLAILLAAGPAHAFDVPSGQPVELQEVLIDTVEAETWLRFRFIAPAIAREAGTIDYQAAAEDMMFLCESFALSYIADYALTGEVIVISLADRETEFGTADPDATQFFEAFRAEGEACIWEGL